MTRYPVMETFLTIQGEGAFAGSAAFFIRLGGCDVGCSWCDVKESWEVGAHPMRDLDDLVREASSHPVRMVVITGGEPMMHDLGPLTEAFRKAGFRTHVETSGAHPLSGEWHWICFSPKKFKDPLSEYYDRAHELKVVVYNHHDLKWANTHADRVSSRCQLFLQPEWTKRAVMTPAMVAHVKEDPRWRISLQTHKYLDIP
ncbi:MAG: 7-carboxy-7-deazaguanine synthase QueE [Flavobacteriales bacterium]|nr:7-carboxy-7-deazaguanine synthase QueE [Flavobacteriales bacterium]